jgi:uncharacterized protein YjbJ (UPF0337 family)
MYSWSVTHLRKVEGGIDLVGVVLWQRCCSPTGGHAHHVRRPEGGNPMGVDDHDRPDDSNEPRHKPGSIREEVSATGQRVKGATKNAMGELIDDEEMEEKGERENAAGKDRQKKNDAV